MSNDLPLSDSPDLTNATELGSPVGLEAPRDGPAIVEFARAVSVKYDEHRMPEETSQPEEMMGQEVGAGQKDVKD